MVLDEPLKAHCPYCGGSDLYVAGSVVIDSYATLDATLLPDGTIKIELSDFEMDKPSKITQEDFKKIEYVGCNGCHKETVGIENLKSVIKAPTFKELQDKIHEGQLSIECS